MTMKLLDLIAEFCGRRGLDVPGAVMGASDQTVIQMRSLVNECLTDITTRGALWPRLVKEASFTSVNAENQGTIAQIAPFGFKYIVDNTFFDRTQKVQVLGPRNAPTWQANEALVAAGAFATYRFMQGNIYLQPVPPAGHAMFFEYASDMAVLDPDGFTWKKRFNKDADTFALDEDLLLAGLHWRWRRENGLSYNQEKLDYETQIVQAIGNASDKGTIHMAQDRPVGPAVIIPAGNWKLP